MALHVKLVYKPSSVLDDYLSRRFVAKPLMRFWGRTSSPTCPTSCTVQSLQLRYVTIPQSELLPHFSTLALHIQLVGGISLLPFSLGHPSLTLSSALALWCSDFPHWLLCQRNHLANFTIVILALNLLVVKAAQFCCKSSKFLYCFFLYSRDV